MSDSFSIDVTQVEHFSQEIAKVPALLERNLLDAANTVGFAGAGIAQQFAPIWQGVLRGSIHNAGAVSIADGVSVSIVTDQQHALTMEEGRKAGSKMPPKGSMLAWMDSHGIPADREFVVRRAIAKHGLAGHFYMKKTLDKLAGGIAEKAFDNAVTKTLAALLGGTA